MYFVKALKTKHLSALRDNWIIVISTVSTALSLSPSIRERQELFLNLSSSFNKEFDKQLEDGSPMLALKSPNVCDVRRGSEGGHWLLWCYCGVTVVLLSSPHKSPSQSTPHPAPPTTILVFDRKVRKDFMMSR